MMAKGRNTALAGMAVALALSGAALVACGGGDDGGSASAPDAMAPEMHEEAAGAEHMEGDAQDAGAAEHMEGDEHEAGEHEDEASHDAEEHAYLEAAPKDTLLDITMTDFAFTPGVLTVAAGDVVEVAIENLSPVVHDFTIDQIDADVHVSSVAGTGEHAHADPDADADVHVALTEPGTGVLHLKVHEPGEYVIYCTVPGHRESGMEATLVVE